MHPCCQFCHHVWCPAPRNLCACIIQSAGAAVKARGVGGAAAEDYKWHAVQVLQAGCVRVVGLRDGPLTWPSPSSRQRSTAQRTSTEQQSCCTPETEHQRCGMMHHCRHASALPATKCSSSGGFQICTTHGSIGIGLAAMVCVQRPSEAGPYKVSFQWQTPRRIGQTGRQ